MGLEDQVYIATYCNTDVFESVINGIPLMRRYSDDWINATQILRIANFPKNKRTKILEKQVQIHTHEKVQGGYGRFQGTWIPLDIARNLATEYGIDATIAPLLYSDSKELIATPFKRKGKPGRNLGIDNDINPSPTKVPKSSEKKKISKKKSDKAVKKLKFQQQEEQLHTDVYHHQQQQMQLHQSLPPPPQFMPQQQQIPYQLYNFPTSQQFQPFYQSPYNIPQFQAIPPQPQPQHQPSNSQDSVNSNVFSTNGERRNSETSVFSNHSVTLISPPVITSQLVVEEDEVSLYTTQLLDYFEKDNAEIPKFLYNRPADFKPNDPIDDEGHTPLHWALSLANLQIIEVLININNANPVISNNAGINCLSKMIYFNNSFELQNFPQILEMFKICLVTPDFNARIPLHYLMELTSRSEKNLNSLNYYLNEIIKFAENLPNQSNKSLLKILLNHQDINGDTALHLCAKNGNKEILKLLLSKGADIDICNASGVSCKNLISIEVLEEFQKDTMEVLMPHQQHQQEQHQQQEHHQQQQQHHQHQQQQQQQQHHQQQQQQQQQHQQLLLPSAQPVIKFKSKQEFIEDKENIFVDGNSGSEYKIEVEEVVKEKALTSFQDKIPNMLESLNDSFVEQINEKDEEYKHSLSIYKTLQANVTEVTKQTNQKSKKLFNATNLSISSIDNKIDSLEKQLMIKQRNYLLFLEKSQSLQLAKLVQQNEQHSLMEPHHPPTSGIDDVLKLSLKQCKRKNMISKLILKLVNYDEDQKNFLNYRKLISKACGLDDINDELLDDIEEALAGK